MFCENCGHELKEGDRFCPECGTPVRENGFSDSAGSTKAEASANTKSAEEMSATQTEKTPSKTHKERKTKKGRKGRTFLAVFFLLFFCAVAVLVVYPGSPVRGMLFGETDLQETVTVSGNVTFMGEGFTDRLILDADSAILAAQDVAQEMGYENAFDELELYVSTSVDGESYYRLQQYYQGIPVYGRYIIVVASEDGEALTITTDAWDIPEDISCVPTVTMETVEEKISEYGMEYWGDYSEKLEISELTEDRLVIYDLSGEACLAYQLNVSAGQQYTVLVRAASGDVICCESVLSEITSVGTDVDGERTFTVNYDETNDTYVLMDLDLGIYISNLNDYEEVTDEVYVSSEDYVKSVGDNIFGNTKEEKNQDADKAINLMINMSDIVCYYKEAFNQDIPTGRLRVYYNDINKANNAAGGYVNVTVYDFTWETAFLTIGYTLECNELNTLAHEYTHIITSYYDVTRSGSDEGINEGLSDTFACFYTNTWDYDLTPLLTDIHRNAGEYGYPSTITDINMSAEDDSHAYAAVISRAAYLMYESGAFTMDELETLWFKTMMLLPHSCKYEDLSDKMGLVAEYTKCTSEQKDAIKNAWDEVEISVKYGSSISLSVYDCNGDLYDNYDVEIEVYNSDDVSNSEIESDEFPKTITVTDASPIELELPVGVYTITVRDGDNSLLSEKSRICVVENGVYNEINFSTLFGTQKSTASSTFTGTVTGTIAADDNATYIKGAIIRFTDETGTQKLRLVTDEDGAFEASLSSGMYTISVEADGYASRDIEIEVNNGETIDIGVICLISDSAKISRKNYYNSDGYLAYYESYAYYDNGLLCSTTLYSVAYNSKAEYSYASNEYTFLYLYDEDGNLTDTVFDVFTIDYYYDENTGEVTFRKGGPNDDYEYISIRPLDESIEQEKYGVDSSKTEIVYGDYPVIPADAENGWAEAYLDEFLVDDEHQSDLEGAEFQLIYIDDDSIPELWIDYLSFAGGSKVCTYYASSDTGREKLNLDLNLSAGYYTDEVDWINTPSQLESGLISFYNETGIAPYVYIIDNIDGDYYPSTEELETFVEEQYEALFTDEGHILLVFWDYGGYYEYTLWLGAQTGTIMDSEACDILFDYLDYYYYEADTDEHFFSYAFEKAGEQIMAATESDGGQTDYVYEGQLAKWISGEGLLKTSGGHSGLYYESVYELQNGTFVLLGEGDYEVIYENGEYLLDEQGYEIYDYIWNGAQTTQEEYEQNLSSIFDESKAEDIYQNVYTYNQCKALLQALVNNSLASMSGESSEEILRHMLEAYTDEEILSFLYDDYDLNGTYEAFALCGKAVDGEGYYGTLYFVTESGVQLVRANEGYWTVGDILDLGSVKIFKINKYGATGGVFYLYQVIGNDFVELAASGKVTGAYFNSEGCLCMTDSQYDAMTDGTGHTWNVYYFYWDDGLKEYGGTLISEEEFLSYDGASDILNTIKADGYNVGAIYLRQNGIININASGGGRNVNIRVLYTDGAVVVYPVGTDYYSDGIIYAAMIPEIATY